MDGMSAQLPAGVDRPLSIAEIADRSVTLAVRRWRTLLVLVLAEAVPVGILRMVRPERPEALMLVSLVPDIALVVLLYGAAAVVTAAPEPPSVTAALRTAASRYGALLAVFIVAWLYFSLIGLGVAFAAVLTAAPVAAMFGRTAAIAVGAVVALLGFVLFLPRAGLVAMIVMPIVALEERSPSKALATAFRRVRNTGQWRARLLGLAMCALLVAPLVVIALTADNVDPKLPAFTLVEELLSDAISLGFGAVVATVISLEMRVRYEGADLELGAARNNVHRGE
ncbi:MAG: hypothetical protein JWM87_539 [Candidatus Eremiobacteraeota bacterium]|nr:hypothetical protein [Candidatus Eremiobacteraeota bacterium]